MLLDNEIFQNVHIQNAIREFCPGGAHLTFHALTHGGSDRMFYRVKGDTASCVLCIGDNREELSYYIEFGQFFHRFKIPVPAFYHHSLEEGFLLMEDAGDLSLREKVRTTEDSHEIEEIYKLALRELFKIQSLDANLCPRLATRHFDYAYLRWETTYFQENLLGNFLKMGDVSFLDAEFQSLAEKMAGEPLYPMHRDFQSQNIHVAPERVFFLDFQGARMGHLLYDAAALLKDPYTNLPLQMQERILEFYHHYLRSHRFISEGFDEFRTRFIHISLQRLMQALGAYGFLGLKKGKTAFLQFISPALHQLNHSLEGIEGFPQIRKVVAEASAIVNSGTPGPK